MWQTFFLLHLTVFIAGFTGLFGRLVSLDAFLLVYFRMTMACALLFLCLKAFKLLRPLSLKNCLRSMAVGCLLNAHLIFFYLAIKVSNVSIGTVTLSCISFFVALLEPLIFRKRFSVTDLGYSLIAMAGLLLMFSFDPRFRLGIVIGIISALCSALYVIFNKKTSQGLDLNSVLFWQLLGGAVFLNLLLPGYFAVCGTDGFYFRLDDFLWLFAAASVCTVLLYLLQIHILQRLSAFSVMLAYNLEPVYSILLAMLLFHEQRDLNYSFYLGIGLIILSVVLKTQKGMHQNRKAQQNKSGM